MNAAALFRDAARAHPEGIAFFEDLRSITYAQLWERVARFSGALHREGFGARDRAVILLPMSVDLYVALLAVLKEGGVAVFLDPWVGARRMLKLARHAGAKAWLGTPKSHLLRLFAGGIDIAPLALRKFERSAKALEEMHDAAPSDRALITFTTGSSGKPKGVNRTHRILVAQHERLAEAFPAFLGSSGSSEFLGGAGRFPRNSEELPRNSEELPMNSEEPPDVDLCTFPIFALNNLALGITTIIPPIDLRRIDKADPRRVADVADQCGATTATSSPPLFDALAKLDRRPTFRRILTGGAPVTDAQLRAWINAWPDAEIVVAYGSSEAEPVAHVEARERLAARGRGYLAGRIAEGVRTKIELIDDRVGELLVAGDHVCRDYDGDDEAERENKLRDAAGTVWHRMGDTGSFDEEGRFWIAGRKHSTIWRNGVAVHAQLVEQAAQADDPRIVRAAALGIDGRVVVIVESIANVAAEVKARVIAAGYPCDAVRVTRRPLPVDPRHNSKIDYAAMLKRLKDEG